MTPVVLPAVTCGALGTSSGMFSRTQPAAALVESAAASAVSKPWSSPGRRPRRRRIDLPRRIPADRRVERVV